MPPLPPCPPAQVRTAAARAERLKEEVGALRSEACYRQADVEARKAEGQLELEALQRCARVCAGWVDGAVSGWPGGRTRSQRGKGGCTDALRQCMTKNRGAKKR